MNLEQKKIYLESYKRAKEEYETLQSDLESVHSASYFTCSKGSNTPPSKTLIDKINAVDNAFIKQLDEHLKLHSLLLADRLLYMKYICFESDEELAKDNEMSIREIRKTIDSRINKLVINE